MSKTLLEVNKIYQKQHPSNYVNLSKKNIDKLINARKDLLIKLKLPIQLFRNSTLLDFGSGSGIYSLIYNLLGAKTDLVEYEKKFIEQSKKNFKQIAKKNTYKIYHSDIFKFKKKKKYDIVTFNGVAHHTQNPNYILDKACKFLSKNGIIIYGIGNQSGFFQRAIQRAILFRLSKNKKELVENAKILFSSHLKRAEKYGGRTIMEIIYDTYLNPKIDCQNTYTIYKIFKKNKIYLHSSYPSLESSEYFLTDSNNYKNFNFQTNKKKIDKKFFYSEHNWLLNYQYKILQKDKIKILEFEKIKNNLTKIINDKNFEKFNFDINRFIKLSKLYSSKIDMQREVVEKTLNINEKKIFFNEIISLMDILSKKNCTVKDVKSFLNKNKLLFKGTSGIGMNYYVGCKF